MTYLDEFMALFKNRRRLNRWAKQTGFRKRRGKLSPYDFVVLMTIGQVGMKPPSLAGMVAAIQARITRVALHYRFSAAAGAFLLKCLRFVLQQKFSRLGEIDTKLLLPFGRVLIADSSRSWDVSGKLRAVLPGSGGAASAANCKLQALYDYKRGELEFLDVTAGTVPDNRYRTSPHRGRKTHIVPGSLVSETHAAAARDAYHKPSQTLERLSAINGEPLRAQRP